MQLLLLSESEKLLRIIGAAVLLVATVVCYVPALRGGFIWDDDRHVSENRTLRNLVGLKRIWADHRYTPQYYPLTHTSYWLEYRVWKLDSTGYHITNILLHAANAMLVWLLLSRLEVPGAFLGAALFALHPIQVESVAWISERKNLLATFFVLLSILPYLRFNFAGYCLSLLFFSAAMCSKTIACSMPAVMLLILWWKWRLRMKEFALLAPFFISGLALGLKTARLEVEHVGASGPEWQLSIAQRFIVAGKAIWFYIGKLLWPVDLTFSYPRWEIVTGDARQWVPLVAIVLVLVALFVQRDRLGRGPLAAALCFVGTLFPALGFFNTYPMRYSFVADHFVYLSSIAFFALIAGAIVFAFDFWLRRPSSVVMGAASPLLVLLAVLTFLQARVYRDSETLWRDTIRKNPDSWMAYNNLGAVLMSGSTESARPRLEEAVALFERAEQLYPQHEKARLNRAEALVKLHRFDEAMQIYEAALARDPNDPRLITQVGIALVQMNRLDAAETRFREAISRDQQLLEPRVRLAQLYQQREQLERAIEIYEQILQTKPENDRAHLELGLLLYRPQINRLDESAVHLARYLEHSPSDPATRAALGFVYGELGRYREAREQFIAALKLDPNDPVAKRGMELLSRPSTTSAPVGTADTWPNRQSGVFKPTHEWAYRWADEIMQVTPAGFTVVESLVDPAIRNRGHTVQNWGKPILLKHDRTGIVMRVWFYRDMPRSIINPAAGEVWAGWDRNDQVFEERQGVSIAAGVLSHDGDEVRRIVGRDASLLIRCEYAGDSSPEEKKIVVDLLLALRQSRRD